jgi:hypothetical protein
MQSKNDVAAIRADDDDDEERERTHLSTMDLFRACSPRTQTDLDQQEMAFLSPKNWPLLSQNKSKVGFISDQYCVVSALVSTCCYSILHG